MQDKVAITGIDVISPCGTGKSAFWKSLQAGRSGISEIRGFDVGQLKCRMGGEIRDFDPSDWLKAPKVKYMQRVEKLACVSAARALEDAQAGKAGYSPARSGIVMGSASSCLRAILEFNRQVTLDGPRAVDPGLVAFGILNSVTGSAAIQNAIGGCHFPISAGQTSALQALDFACIQLQNRAVDLVLAGGIDELTPELYAGFQMRRLLSGSKNGSRLERSLPFDCRRDGIVLGEACAILVLERLEDALARKARIYALVEGFGTAFQGRKASKKAGVETMKRAIDLALGEAEAGPDEVGAVYASANGSFSGDLVEREAILQSDLRSAYVVAVKSLLGECMGASGALQTAAAALSLRQQKIPPTPCFEDSGNRQFNRMISPTPIRKRMRAALVNSLCPAGSCASLLLRAHKKGTSEDEQARP